MTQHDSRAMTQHDSRANKRICCCMQAYRLLHHCLYTYLNLFLQVGYYCAAFTVDKAWMGRVRLQSMVRAFSGLLPHRHQQSCMPVAGPHTGASS